MHFETGNCYVEDVRTGRKTKVEEKGGTFEIGIWIPAAASVNQCSAASVNQGVVKATFHRQDEEF